MGGRDTLSPAHLGNPAPDMAWPESKAQVRAISSGAMIKAFPTLLRQRYSSDAKMLSLG